MKTVLITINNAFQARDLLRSDFLKCFKADKKWKVILLVPKDKADHYRELYSGANVVVETNPTELDKLNKFETLAYILGHKSIHSEPIRILHERLRGNLLLYVLSNICWFLGGFRLWRESVRLLFALSTDGSHFGPVLDKHKPDLIYAVNLLNFDEFRLLHEARRRKIQTCALILSWDNLNSKLFIYYKAGKYVVPNYLVRDELVRLGDIRVADIGVCGIVKYDGFFRKEGVISKEDFFAQLGIPTNDKLAVYCLSTRNTSPVYEDIFEDLISIKNEMKGVTWVIRGYPKYALSPELTDKIRNAGIIYNHPADFSEEIGDYEIKNEDDIYLRNLFFHADVVVTNYSTVAIEASIFDKPVININYDGKVAKSYPWSVRRIRDYTHYMQIISADAEDCADDKEEFKALVEENLNNPRLRSVGRERVVIEQCAFQDGQSGKRMYQYLVGLV